MSITCSQVDGQTVSISIDGGVTAERFSVHSGNEFESKVAEVALAALTEPSTSSAPADLASRIAPSSLLFAASEGNIEALNAFLALGMPISEDSLSELVRTAAIHGHDDVTYRLLSEGRALPEEALADIIIEAAGDFKASVLSALFADGRTISDTQMEDACRTALEASNWDNLRTLLTEGPQLNDGSTFLFMYEVPADIITLLDHYDHPARLEDLEHAFVTTGMTGDLAKAKALFNYSKGHISASCFAEAIHEALKGNNEGVLSLLTLRPKATLNAAAETGRHDVVTYLKSAEDFSRSDILDAALCAAENGEVKIYEDLFSSLGAVADDEVTQLLEACILGENKTLLREILAIKGRMPIEDVEQNLQFAAENGRQASFVTIASVYSVIYPGDELASCTQQAAMRAVAAGHAEFVEHIDAETLTPHGVTTLAEALGTSGDTTLLFRFLEAGVEFIHEDIQKMLDKAMAHHHDAFVASAIRNTDLPVEPFLSSLFVTAARFGLAETFQLLQDVESTGTPNIQGRALQQLITQGHWELALSLLESSPSINPLYFQECLEQSCQIGRLDLVTCFLQRWEPTTRHSFERALTLAARYGHADIVSALLSYGRSISYGVRGELVRLASNRGRVEVIRRLLSQGPITETMRRTAENQAHWRESTAIREALAAAHIIEETSDTTELLGPHRNVFSTTYAQVKENPVHFLKLIKQFGFPDHIELQDAPHATDLGGLTKQFLTTLFEAIVEQNLIQRGELGIPLLESEPEENILELMGFLFSSMDARNEERSDRLVTGHLFPVSFFEIVAATDAATTDEEVLIGVSKPFIHDQKNLGLVARLILSKLDPDALEEPSLSEQASAAASSSSSSQAAAADSSSQATSTEKEATPEEAYAKVMWCEPEEAFEDAKGLLEGYVRAGQAFRSGASEELLRKLRTSGASAFTEAVQGQAVSKEGVLASLANHGVSSEHFEWVQEWVRSADEEQLKQFVFAITGNKTLPVGTKLKIKCREDSSDIFELHTCFNSLDLPQTLTREGCLAGITGAVQGSGYETA